MKLITIDFDNTLCLYSNKYNDINKVESRPNKTLLKLINQWKATGHQIYIVTFRCESESKDVLDFVEKHNVPIDDIIYTCSKPKINFLKKIKSQLHIDDDFTTVADAMMANIDTMLPPVDEYYIKDKNETKNK